MNDQLASKGQANTCPHSSATGVDTAPVGPGKVWRCDHCGLTYRDGGDGRVAELVDEMRVRGARLALGVVKDALAAERAKR